MAGAAPAIAVRAEALPFDDAEHGHLRELEELDGALRLVISEP